MPVAQIDHGERAFIAAASTPARRRNDDPVKALTRALLDDADATEARALGLALRLAYTLSGGALELLGQVRLPARVSGIALELPPTGNLFAGEAVTRQLDALGSALDVAARTRRRETAAAEA